MQYNCEVLFDLANECFLFPSADMLGIGYPSNVKTVTQDNATGREIFPGTVANVKGVVTMYLRMSQGILSTSLCAIFTKIICYLHHTEGETEVGSIHSHSR